MPNRLTGDFESVLQVSGSTINRLLASMHQNAGSGLPLPSLPHVAFMHLGGTGPSGGVDGVRGSARAQIAVPRIELIHKARDRAIIEVWLRAHFRADPGSTAFPEFIYGVLRVEYIVETIPAHAWKFRSYNVLRLRPAPNSVIFTSAGPDHSHDPAISRQCAALLDTQFEMKPHPVLTDFQQERLMSLAGPGGATAVVAAADISGAKQAGDLNSVHEIVLDGKDFAAAVSREYILSILQPHLDAIKAKQISFTFTVKAPKILGIGGGVIFSATYLIQITKATADWSAGTMTVGGVQSPCGVITFRFEGKAETSSWGPNATFSIDHSLWLGFNQAAQSMFLMSSGPPGVSVDVNGPFGGLFEGRVESEVANTYTAQINAALVQANAVLQQTSGKRQQLVVQLQSVDDQADAQLTEAWYSHDGLVLRGTVILAPRRVLKVEFGRLDNQSGYTGFLSWIPGGRIHRFDWRWLWFASASSGPYGPVIAQHTQTHDDRFVLHTNLSLPGLPPVTGSPGPSWPQYFGGVCLGIRGKQMNAVTGVEEEVDSSALYAAERLCQYFYPEPPPAPSVGIEIRPKLWWKLWAVAGGPGGSTASAAPEMAVLEVGTGRTSSPPFNMLVVSAGESGSIENVSAAVDGLRSAGRDDAGAIVVAVFAEGALDRGGPELGAKLGRLAESSSAPFIATEDVRGGWSKTFGFAARDSGGARLLTADRRIAWSHDGPLDRERIAGALRVQLIACDPPEFSPVDLAVRMGEPAPDFTIETAPDEQIQSARLRGGKLIVCFAQAWSTPCLAQLRRLKRTRESLERDGASIIALVEGDEHHEAQELAKSLGIDYSVALDRQGAIAREFGVRIWPTTVVIDEIGLVAAIHLGADPGALAAFGREQGA